LTSPWTVISGPLATLGNDVPQTYIDNTATNPAAFYTVIQPDIRLQTRYLYVDGQLQPITPGDSIDVFQGTGAIQSKPAKTGGQYRLNGWFYADTFIFGGFLRAAGEGGFVNASYSDAAVWSRALSTNELAAYMRDGCTNASALTAALFANLSGQFPAAVQGDQDLLNWQAAKAPATLTLNPGFGSVTAISSQGIGSTNATISSNTVFTLVASRSGLSVTSAPVTVFCVSNVAAGWRYIDSFTYLGDGPIAGQGGWLNPIHGPATATGMGDLEVYTSSGGNNYAGFDGYDANATPAGAGAVAGRNLFSSLGVQSGNTNTLFFRFYISPAATNEDPSAGEITGIQIQAGLSDLGILDVAINGGAGGGPDFTIIQPEGGGPIDLQAVSAGGNGITTTPGSYSYTNDVVNGNANGLIAGHVYNVWIDVINYYPGVVGGWASGGEQTNAALYAVWLQRDDWASRTNLFSATTCTNSFGGIENGVVYPTGYLLSPRDYSVNNQDNTILGPSANLDYLFLLQAGTPVFQSTNAVRYDDFFISNAGFNGTVPVTAGAFTP